MNRDEAIDAIYAGKKVRHKNWRKDIYLYLSCDEIQAYAGTVELGYKDGYELYEEPKKECCKGEKTEEQEHPLQSLVNIIESLNDFHKEFFKDQEDSPKPPNVDQISIDQMYKWAKERWEKVEELKPDQAYFYNNLMQTYTFIFKEKED